VGRFPGVVASLQPWANFRSAFSAFEFVPIREIRVCGFFNFSPNRKKVEKSIAINFAFDNFSAPRRP
jgi:hypothetical protein